MIHETNSFFMNELSVSASLSFGSFSNTSCPQLILASEFSSVVENSDTDLLEHFTDLIYLYL